MLRYMFVVFSAFLLFSPWCAQADDAVYDRILVKINDDIITQFDLNEEMKPILNKIGDRKLNAVEQEQLKKMRGQVLDKMVNDRLMAQEIQKYNITVDDDRVDSEIERIKNTRGYSDEEFERTVKNDGLTMAEFRAKIKDIIQKQDLLGYMVHSKVVVTDSEIQDEYEKHLSEYSQDKTVSLAIIILPSDVSVKEVRKRIMDGELTFAQAAEKYTIGPGKDDGGSIGDVVLEDLADDWRAALEGVDEGGVSAPLEVRGNKALLSPVKINSDNVIPLDEVRDDIFKRLTDEKRETIFEEYFNKLKQSSVIVYMN